MDLLRSASLALALTGLVWSLVLLVRVRDGRAAFLAVLLALIAAGEALALAALWSAPGRRADAALPDSLVGLLTSAAAVLAVAFLQRMLLGKRGELARLRADVSERQRADDDRAEQLRRSRRQQEALVAIAQSPAVIDGDLQTALREITQAAAEALQVERVGVWLLADEGGRLRCAHLFERSPGRHSEPQGLMLDAGQFPRYFRALADVRALDADQAQTDERTGEFRESYLEPLGITSMLDAGIRISGDVVGVVCHEHIGPAHAWSTDEIAFAGAVADQVAQVLIQCRRRQAEDAARRAQQELLEHQQRERERIAEELDKARAQLVKSTQLATLGELSAQLAHDVRNCVTPISNYAYLIKRNLPADQPPLREALEEIQEEVRMCDQILRNLVEYAGLKEPDRCWTDLSRLASKALRNLHLPEGVRVERCFQPDPLLAEIDPTQLRRVLDNLLRNAAEAVSDSGEIRIFGSQEPQAVVIVIEDSGPGIQVDDPQSIFQPFVTTKSKGGGFGLASCRHIVELHGGTISLLDRPAGAAFCIRLPRAPDA